MNSGYKFGIDITASFIQVEESKQIANKRKDSVSKLEIYADNNKNEDDDNREMKMFSEITNHSFHRFNFFYEKLLKKLITKVDFHWLRILSNQIATD